MKKTIKLITTCGLLFLVVSLFAVAKNDKAKANPNANKDKQEVIEKFKDFEKSNSGKSDADIYQEKMNKVSTDLSEVVEKGKAQGEQKKEENAERNQINNPGVGNQLSERVQKQEEAREILASISEETQEIQTGTVKAMKNLEKQNNFKKFLIGTDYENLGQLRSSLAHNENQVRQLTKISEELEDGEDKEAVKEQLMTLMQERERIKEVINKNESSFSILGWAFRWINGYSKDSINENEEAELEEEVAEVLIEDESQ